MQLAPGSTTLASPAPGAGWPVSRSTSTRCSTRTGKPRHRIFSIAHLSDAERSFFRALRTGPRLDANPSRHDEPAGDPHIDEIFGFLPPVANPPTTAAADDVQAGARLRSPVATQNPVDLDYKASRQRRDLFLGGCRPIRPDPCPRRLFGGGAATANGGESRGCAARLGNRPSCTRSIRRRSRALGCRTWPARSPATRSDGSREPERAGGRGCLHRLGPGAVALAQPAGGAAAGAGRSGGLWTTLSGRYPDLRTHGSASPAQLPAPGSSPSRCAGRWRCCRRPAGRRRSIT